MGTSIRSGSLGSAVTRPAAYTHTRYLEAKRTVDDRALHRPTLARLRESLVAVPEPVRVVEAGCGTGSMLRRLLDRNVLPTPAEYRGYDLRADAVDRAVDELTSWGAETGYTVETDVSVSEADRRVRLDRPGDRSGTVTATFTVGDAVEAARTAGSDATGRGDPGTTGDEGAAYDLLVGCAFLDLVDLDRALEPLLGLVPGGLAYFPITFDGETFLRPSLTADGPDGIGGPDGPDGIGGPDGSGEPGGDGGDGGTDETAGNTSTAAVLADRTERTILDVYHGTMDEPDRPGGSRTGRELFDALPDVGADVVACGGSDWLVTPPYPADEAYFLHHLVDGIEDAVTTALNGNGSDAGDTGRDDAEPDDGGRDDVWVAVGTGDADIVDPDGRHLTPATVEAWADARHRTIAADRLTFGAHNLDVLARVDPADPGPSDG